MYLELIWSNLGDQNLFIVSSVKDMFYGSIVHCTPESTWMFCKERVIWFSVVVKVLLRLDFSFYFDLLLRHGYSKLVNQ